VELRRTPEKINDPFTEPERFSDDGVTEPAIHAARWKRGTDGVMRPESPRETEKRALTESQEERSREQSNIYKPAKTEEEWLSVVEEASIRAREHFRQISEDTMKEDEPIIVNSVTTIQGPSGFTTTEKEKWREEERAFGSQISPRQVHFENSEKEFYSSTPKDMNQTELMDDKNIDTPKEKEEISREDIAVLKEILQRVSKCGVSESETQTGLAKSANKSSMPASAYLSNRLSAEPPDDDRGSSSSSESEDSNEEDRRNVRRTTPLPNGREETPATRSTRKRVQKLKLPEPFVYDGSPDYDRFEQWCYEVDNWMDLSGVDQYYALKYLATYLSGRAATFYMTHVATSVSQYTVEKLYRDLFEYCFPVNFKRKLRDRFFQLTQGTRNVRDFLRELQRLGSRLADVTDKDIAQRFWKGVHSYIRIELAKKGKDSENTSLKKLAKRATRYENAENLRLEELREAQQALRLQWRRGYTGSSNNQQNHMQFQQRSSLPVNYPILKPSMGSSNHLTPQPRSRGAESGRGNTRGHVRGRGGGVGTLNRRARLSKEEQNELRAENKCFECKEIGHLARDCPKRRQAVPSRLQSSGIRIGKVALGGERNTDVMRCSSMRLIGPDSCMSISTKNVIRGIQRRQERAELTFWKNQVFGEYIHQQETSQSRGNEIAKTYRAGANIGRLDLISKIFLGSVKKAKRKEKLGLTGQPYDEVAIQRNASRLKDFNRKTPRPIVVEVLINGEPAQALIDSGSMADFVSTKLVDQLRLKRHTLAKPLGLQLAVAGSRSKINTEVEAKFKYQEINTLKRFDVANLDSYDIILGTPFIFQHKVLLGLNPTRVGIGSVEPLPIRGVEIATVKSMAAEIKEEEIEKIRQELKEEAQDLCQEALKTGLPPLRAINHRIPLIDEKKIYAWRPSRCPEPLKQQWREKRQAYLQTGRWRIATGTNAMPMLIIKKPYPGPNGEVLLRTVVDKRQQNDNTRKLVSPLPDMDAILRNAASHPYKTLLDGKDAYEQIRVEPEDVSKTLFSTPDGTMESLVMQLGDCNAPATYQMLMNHIFAPYIGIFMDVYLDDIVIYSDSVEDHVKHIRTIFEVLRKERLFLSPSKMQFFAERLKVLGHIIDSEGILMDPHKVDKVMNWKTPTNSDLLAGFIGSVGYLAPDCEGVQIPMGILTPLSSGNRPWRWGPTEERAFGETKRIVEK